jgi:hypothetical protein
MRLLLLATVLAPISVAAILLIILLKPWLLAILAMGVASYVLVDMGGTDE